MSVSTEAFNGMVDILADRDEEIVRLKTALREIATLDETHASYTASRLAREALNWKPSRLLDEV